MPKGQPLRGYVSANGVYRNSGELDYLTHRIIQAAIKRNGGNPTSMTFSEIAANKLMSARQPAPSKSGISWSVDRLQKGGWLNAVQLPGGKNKPFTYHMTAEQLEREYPKPRPVRRVAPTSATPAQDNQGNAIQGNPAIGDVATQIYRIVTENRELTKENAELKVRLEQANSTMAEINRALQALGITPNPSPVPSIGGIAPESHGLSVNGKKMGRPTNASLAIKAAAKQAKRATTTPELTAARLANIARAREVLAAKRAAQAKEVNAVQEAQEEPTKHILAIGASPEFF